MLASLICFLKLSIKYWSAFRTFSLETFFARLKSDLRSCQIRPIIRPLVLAAKMPLSLRRFLSFLNTPTIFFRIGGKWQWRLRMISSSLLSRRSGQRAFPRSESQCVPVELVESANSLFLQRSQSCTQFVSEFQLETKRTGRIRFRARVPDASFRILQKQIMRIDWTHTLNDSAANNEAHTESTAFACSKDL